MPGCNGIADTNPVPIACAKALADKCGSGKGGMIQALAQTNQVKYTCVDSSKNLPPTRRPVDDFYLEHVPHSALTIFFVKTVASYRVSGPGRPNKPPCRQGGAHKRIPRAAEPEFGVWQAIVPSTRSPQT